MGTRINRVAGYALTGVQTDNGLIVDPRVNPASCLLDDEQEAPSLTEHLRWLGNRSTAAGDYPVLYAQSMLRSVREAMIGTSLHACLTFDSECGDPSTLVLTTPYELKQLKRRDDPIDYVMETLGDFNGDPAVVNLPKGVGFHYGELMDRRTGVQVCADSSRLISSITEFPKLAEYYDLEGLPLWATGDAAMTPLYRSCAEAVENVVPLVPASIRLVAEHCELFADPDVWKTLRPVVYTFWS